MLSGETGVALGKNNIECVKGEEVNLLMLIEISRVKGEAGDTFSRILPGCLPHVFP